MAKLMKNVDFDDVVVNYKKDLIFQLINEELVVEPVAEEEKLIFDAVAK